MDRQEHNLISKSGFFFIAELIIDLELVYDPPTTDHCGNCTACIDACPTDALIEPCKLTEQMYII